MRLLLTSAGIKNPTIHAALVDMLDKPIDECAALLIPTAAYGHPAKLPGKAWSFVNGQPAHCPMAELGWKSLGLLELSALPSLPDEHWVPMVREADVFLANGGDSLFLAHWMRESGFDELLPTLKGAWVGFSGGSMALTPRIGDEFKVWEPPGGGDKALGIVDFSIFPHLDHPDLPENTMAAAEEWAAGVGNPSYAIDDDTAIKWIDGDVEVVSGGHWRYFD